jgi:nitroimidazol reductase NimA-like FMN-containing flavoprotein (pyridoxamine 5'-phosphate oxidase superfamily)
MPWIELDREEIDAFLAGGRVLRLAMGGGSERYVLPLGYLWHEGAFYCATTEGRKTEFLERDNGVAFEIDNAGCERPFLWTSVIGEGVATRVEDEALIESLRPLLFARFEDAPRWAMEESRQQAKDGALIWLRITPRWMSARRGVPPEDGSA